ncbi:hypothetical protein ACLK15_16305 [Escherichia coli]
MHWLSRMMPNACSAASGRQGILPYGAFGEIFWETQCQEMQQLADESLPVASRGRVWKLISPATVCR